MFNIELLNLDNYFLTMLQNIKTKILNWLRKNNKKQMRWEKTRVINKLKV